MKRLLFAPMIVLLLFACEGKQGPMGPPGAGITYIYGDISANDYYGSYIEINHTAIDEDAVTQFYVTPNFGDYGWLNIGQFEMADDWIYIYDPDRDLSGWEYMIMIVTDAYPEDN
jgi:hypothetical protein